MLREVVLEFPVELPEEGLQDKEALEKGKEAIVLELFRKGKISSGYAADLLGLCLADFIDFLKQKEIPFAHYTEEDLKMDRNAIKQYEQLKRGKGA